MLFFFGGQTQENQQTWWWKTTKKPIKVLLPKASKIPGPLKLAAKVPGNRSLAAPKRTRSSSSPIHFQGLLLVVSGRVTWFKLAFRLPTGRCWHMLVYDIDYRTSFPLEYWGYTYSPGVRPQKILKCLGYQCGFHPPDLYFWRSTLQNKAFFQILRVTWVPGVNIKCIYIYIYKWYLYMMSIWPYLYTSSLYISVPEPPKGPRATLLFDLPRSPGCSEICRVLPGIQNW